MLFFPYKADVDLGRWPVLTLLVCAVCAWVFARQLLSEFAYQKALDDFCTHRIAREELVALRYLDTSHRHYCELLVQVRDAPDRSAAIRDLVSTSRSIPFYRERADGEKYLDRVLTESAVRFERAVPRNLTDELHFDPSTLNLKRMVTATFSHGDVWHLVFNLIFFFAFAASVEVVAGYWYFLGFLIMTAVGTHLAYAYSVRGLVGALPTIGLSGVVMAMMAFAATVAPTLRIRCFFWFIVFVRVFRIPALLLAGLYIAQNIFDYSVGDPSDNVNYVAHLSGAAIGVVMGLVYRFRNRQFLRDLLSGI